MSSSRLRLVVLLLLSACATRGPTDPPRPLSLAAAGERQYTVREVTLADGVIAVRLEIPAAPPGPKPAVLANLNESATMLQEGVVAVTYKIDWSRFDGGAYAAAPPPAQNPVGKWVLAAPTPATVGQQYLRQIAQTATVIVPRIVDYLETVPEIDASRLAITGGSTNGFIALQAVAADRRLGVATAVAACGDYHGFLRDSSMGMEGRPLALDPAYERWIRSQEIVRHPRRVVHAALLMVNRVQDPLIPIGCADETARVLRRAFDAAGRGDRFRFVRIEDAEGHGLGDRENGENVAWLRTWLLGPR